jgi:hypothetical protein
MRVLEAYPFGKKSTMRTLGTCIAAAALALAVGSSTVPAGAQAGRVAASSADAAFVSTLLQEAHGQIVFAQFAEQRSHDASVRNLAAENLAAWSALADRLAAAAPSDMVAGDALTEAQQRMLDELGQTHPADFDAAYLRVVETDSARALRAFSDEAGTTNPKLRAAIDDVGQRFAHIEAATGQ